jgi:Kelch motif
MSKHVAPMLILTLLMPLLIMSVKPVSAASQGAWMTLAPMPTPRVGLDAVVIDGKIYAMGGTSDEGSSNKNEEYDPTTNTWTTKPPLPTGRTWLAAVTVQNKIYTIGGVAEKYPGIPTAKNEVYDPYSNTWTTKTEMPTARTETRANNVNDQIYVIGGFESAGSTVEPSNKNEAYDPRTDTWTTKADMPYPAVYHSSVVIGDKIYVLASPFPPFQTDTPPISNSAIQIYDTKTDSWSLGPHPPTVQRSADAVTILDKQGRELIYIFGGGGYGNYTDLVQIYDPQNDVGDVGSPLPTPRYGLAVAVVNGQIYALGGITSGGAYGTLLATNERYSPLESLPTPTPTPTAVPFPTVPLMTVSVTIVVLAAAGFLLYRKRGRGRTQ